LVIDRGNWKKMDMINKFPHVFVINKQKPTYYQVGASKTDFSELLKSRENAENDNNSMSSWHKVKNMPEVASLFNSNFDREMIFIISPDSSLFDCTACNVQTESLNKYVTTNDSQLIAIHIK
jgi:hypothetical protein